MNPQTPTHKTIKKVYKISITTNRLKKLIQEGKSSAIQSELEFLDKFDKRIICGNETIPQDVWDEMNKLINERYETLKAQLNSQVVSKEQKVTSLKELVTPTTEQLAHESADTNCPHKDKLQDIEDVDGSILYRCPKCKIVFRKVEKMTREVEK